MATEEPRTRSAEECRVLAAECEHEAESFGGNHDLRAFWRDMAEQWRWLPRQAEARGGEVTIAPSPAASAAEYRNRLRVDASRTGGKILAMERVRELRQKAESYRQAARRPSEGGGITDRILFRLADQLDRAADERLASLNAGSESPSSDL